MSEFSERLVSARKSCGMSQKALAEAVDVAQGYVSKLENGLATQPAASLVAKLEKVLRVTTGSLSMLLGADVPTAYSYATPSSEDEGVFQLPVVGSTGPGITPKPIGEFNFKEHLGKSGRWMFRVPDEAMSGVGIYEGDFVVVEPCTSADPGRAVVALMDTTAFMVRNLVHVGHSLQLTSAHPNYPPISLGQLAGASRVQIIGIVVAILRTYEKTEFDPDTK